MNFKKLFIILGAVALLPALAFVKIKEAVPYDGTSATSVVKAANKMLAMCDFEQLLTITELSEKKRTQMTIDTIKTNAKALKIIMQESQKIEFFEILKEEVYTNNNDILAIVYTKWRMKIDYSLKPGKPVNEPGTQNKPYSEVYVDYLLRKFDGQWKIISKKSK
ncbi:MAG: hypothetical protein A2Y33_03315 [Spirochaetes bacterium GWF1_51_8]|nr:MAG: hypothetical protein A2Y33_03315 [Spirochaetes bacterium GWF1_51_8]